jgi:ligand-binding SRPBCC domain-containing protein
MLVGICSSAISVSEDVIIRQWESIQEFQGNGNTTHIRHTIEYELPTTGKIANTLSGNQADNKIKQGLEQAAQTVKQTLES